MVEVLKQPPYSPIPVEKQVVIIFTGNKGYLDKIPVNAVTKFEAELMAFLDAKYSNIFESIRTEKKLTPETEEILIKALDEFSETFSA